MSDSSRSRRGSSDDEGRDACDEEAASEAATDSSEPDATDDDAVGFGLAADEGYGGGWASDASI